MQRLRIGRSPLHMTARRNFFKGSGIQRRLEGFSMRIASLCVLSALALGGCASGTSLTGTYTVLSSSTDEAAAAASIISAYRVSRGLSPVTVDPRLNRAAEHQ